MTVIGSYPGRFLSVFLLNAVSALISIFAFVMIEPFLKLLFNGNLEGLSVISSFMLGLFGRFMPIESLDTSFVVLVCAAIILFLLKNLFQYSSQCVMAHVRSHFTYSFRGKLYRKIVALPLGYFNRESRGDVISRVVSDTQEAEYTILTSIYQWLTDPVTLLFYLSVLFYIDYQLTLWALLLLPVSFLAIGLISHSLRRDSKKSKQRFGDLIAHVEETISGYRIMTAYNQQGNFYRKFDELSRKFHDKQRTIYRKSYLASPLGEFLGVSVVMAVLVIGGTLVLSQRSPLSAELFITYIAIFSQIINPVKNVSSAFAEYKRGEAALDRIDSFLAVSDDVRDTDDSEHVDAFNREIRFHNVSFSYPGNEDAKVLNDVDITIGKGSTVAFVGESGSGKTTMLDVLMRFYDPVDGFVSLDGKDIRRYDIQDYRALFALVSQDVVIFHDTFFNNITLGYVATQEQVEYAAKSAGIYDFICSFPDGFNHRIGDMGIDISGGQRQKISIARAILRGAPVVVMDEATSAMDTDSERFMQESLANEFRDCTKIVVAHRLSTVANADCIYVMHEGRIVESGTHQELIESKSYYYNLLTNQK